MLYRTAPAVPQVHPLHQVRHQVPVAAALPRQQVILPQALSPFTTRVQVRTK